MRLIGRFLLVALIAFAAVTAYRARSWPQFRSESLRGNSHGKRIADSRCIACHGAAGDAPEPQYPKLAGQKAAYLDQQLQAFKDNIRKSAVMTAIATSMSPADMRDTSAYFSEQTPRADAPGPLALRSQGRILFHSGTLVPGAPPCSACHDTVAGGPRGGMGPMIGMGRMGGMQGLGLMRRGAPNLFGQHATYIVSQLQAFADGNRRAPMMAQIAASIDPEQRAAIAQYLAAQQ